MTFILYFSFNIKLNVSQGFYYLSTQNKLSTLFIVAVYRTPSGSQLLSKYSTRMVFEAFLFVGDPCSTPVASRFYYTFLNKKLQPAAKYRDSLTKKRPFLLQIVASHRSVRYRNTDLPPPLHSKLFLQVLSMVLYCSQL